MPLGRKHLRRTRAAPTGGVGLKRTTSSLGGNPGEVKHLIRCVSARGGRMTGRQSWVVSRRQNPILKRRWNGREPTGTTAVASQKILTAKDAKKVRKGRKEHQLWNSSWSRLARYRCPGRFPHVF